MTAAEWASTVSASRYKRHRDELDSLVVGSVPSYADKVDSILNDFVHKVRDSHAKYDAEHDVARLLRPLKPTLLTATLWWISLLGGIVAFAAMVAKGAPSVDYYDVDPNVRALVASLAFAAGTAAQLVRALPIRPSVPPRADIAWISSVFGAIALGIMVDLLARHNAVSPLWVVIAGTALAASSVCTSLSLLARRRNRDLATRVDTIEEDRLRAARDRLEQQADDCADAIEATFKALPSPEQKTLMTELLTATRARARAIDSGTCASESSM